MGLTTIKRGGVALEAVEQIKQMIIAGRFKAGEKLPAEHELAQLLGVSRPTIREAIRGLAALRIVEPVHGSGTFVSSLSPELLAEPIDFLVRVNVGALLGLFEARVVLETGLVRLAAERRTDAQLSRLQQLSSDYAIQIEDLAAVAVIDLAFHAEIARAADSPILSSLLSTVAAIGLASREQTGRHRAVREQTCRDHELIWEALNARDADRAERAMRDHLGHARAALQRE